MDADTAPAPEPEAAEDDFIESSTFAGPKPGYVYGNRSGKIGYHVDAGTGAVAAPNAVEPSGWTKDEGALVRAAARAVGEEAGGRGGRTTH